MDISVDSINKRSSFSRLRDDIFRASFEEWFKYCIWILEVVVHDIHKEGRVHKFGYQFSWS
jgi:hypothetical protein